MGTETNDFSRTSNGIVARRLCGPSATIGLHHFLTGGLMAKHRVVIETRRSDGWLDPHPVPVAEAERLMAAGWYTDTGTGGWYHFC